MNTLHAQILWQVMDQLRDANQFEEALFSVIINTLVYRKVKDLNLRDIA